MFGRNLHRPFDGLVYTLFCTAILSSMLSISPANAEEAKSKIIGFTCSLETAGGDVVDAVLEIGDEDIVSLTINELNLHNVVAIKGHSHSPAIAFSTNMDSRGVYTLTIHRDFFLPHPDGYDPSKPPATLTIQSANEEMVPEVVVFLGDCEFFSSE